MTLPDNMNEALREIVRRVVAQCAPERIILFGSLAYGQPDEDSDIDLLIVMNTPERFLQRMVRIRKVAEGAHPRIAFEPIVLTPEEMASALKRGNAFVKEIIHRGEVLYAA